VYGNRVVPGRFRIDEESVRDPGRQKLLAEHKISSQYSAQGYKSHSTQRCPFFALEHLLFPSDLLDREELQKRTVHFLTLEQRSSVEA
jgi:hypothetical protein